MTDKEKQTDKEKVELLEMWCRANLTREDFEALWSAGMTTLDYLTQPDSKQVLWSVLAKVERPEGPPSDRGEGD